MVDIQAWALQPSFGPSPGPSTTGRGQPRLARPASIVAGGIDDLRDPRHNDRGKDCTSGLGCSGAVKGEWERPAHSHPVHQSIFGSSYYVQGACLRQYALLLEEPGRSFTSSAQTKRNKQHRTKSPHDQPGSQTECSTRWSNLFFHATLLSIKMRMFNVRCLSRSGIQDIKTTKNAKIQYCAFIGT